jgi:hypothetical protein
MLLFALKPLLWALAVTALALAAAGCRNGGAPTTAAAVSSSAPCKLDRAQRRAVARTLADIRRLRRIEAPVRSYSQRGAPNEDVVTGQVLVDLGSAKLPLNVFSRLLHLAKGAVRLCGACSQGLEAEEPFLGTRAHSRCG